MILIDSCGWLEYFSDGPLAEKYFAYLKKTKEVITPSIVLYEVYKKIKKERKEESALMAAAMIQETQIVPLSDFIALTAADISLACSLPMADAIVYATGKLKNANIITSDIHFKKLKNVVFID
jgi:predicted nucleic acid-binding protein